MTFFSRENQSAEVLVSLSASGVRNLFQETFPKNIGAKIRQNLRSKMSREIPPRTSVALERNAEPRKKNRIGLSTSWSTLRIVLHREESGSAENGSRSAFRQIPSDRKSRFQWEKSGKYYGACRGAGGATYLKSFFIAMNEG